jgi:hypothetical protein
VIAQLWEFELSSSRKADMAAELVTALATANAVDRSLDRLSSEERAALDDLVRHGGAIPWAIFVRRWGQVRAIGAGRIEREGLWRDPASAAESLFVMGWVHRSFDDRLGKPVEMAFAPEELMLYLPAPPQLQIAAPHTTEAPPIQELGSDALADDLVTFWSSLQRIDLQREHVVSQLHAPAARRLLLIETLSVEAGWIHQLEGQFRPVPSAILTWLRADLWAQWSTLAQAWITSQAYNDISHVPNLTPDPVNHWPNEPRHTREAFLSALRRCDPGAWYDLGMFVQYVKHNVTDFLRPDGDYVSWAPRDAHTEAPLRGFDEWDAVEGALIADFISGPLSWLGLVDLGRDPAATMPTAFRLTEAGRALLADGAPPSFHDIDPLEMDDRAEILAPPRRRFERFQLSRIAEFIGGPGVYRYRLSPTSIDRAKQQRISHDRILAFLKQATGHNTLPRAMETAIERSYHRAEGGRLSHTWVLRVPDPQVLQRPEVQALIEEQITTTAATVREEHTAQLIQRLLETGVLLDIVPDKGGR